MAVENVPLLAMEMSHFSSRPAEALSYGFDVMFMHGLGDLNPYYKHRALLLTAGIGIPLR